MRAVILALAACSPAFAETHRELILAEKPAAYWNFDDSLDCCANEQSGAALKAEKTEVVSLVEPGPRTPKFPGFDMHNVAADFTADGGRALLKVKDPGADSMFDFAAAQTITIEAWVRCDGLKDGQHAYIAGKGRTGNPGVAANNQSWALRLRGARAAGKPVACVTFLFRDEKNSGEQSWHRWTSSRGFTPGEDWHHVAVTYTFGKPASAKAWINGEALGGTWDMGGPSELGPVRDDDEVWIGSGNGGGADSQFPGRIDELAIFRAAPDEAKLRQRARREGAAPALTAVALTPPVAKPPMPVPAFKIAELPAGKVRVEIREFPLSPDEAAADVFGDDADAKKKPSTAREPSWGELAPNLTAEFVTGAFALGTLPDKYTSSGVKADRSRPFLVRAAGVVTLPAGQHTLHLRALAGTRVAVDGIVLIETPLTKKKYGDAEPVPDLFALQLEKTMPLLPPGHTEKQAVFTSDGTPRVFVVESWVGGKSIRPEIGELSLWSRAEGGKWSVVTGVADLAPLLAAQSAEVAAFNRATRRHPSEDAYWKMRHNLARQHARPAATGRVDDFLASKPGFQNPAPLVDDAAFLRRVTLDTIGLTPTVDEVRAFLADSSPDKRQRAVDRLLADPRWADHWTSYWQDVLAENPNILKGTLNNTGPFRWWIHESLLDNKPMDRFATELVMMEGSASYGGPAGFGIATQNDMPFAAKAQVLAGAFLANEMKCARCHDAVHHSFEQRELFQIAAMLGKAPLKVPESSLTKGLKADSHVQVTLKPGEMIAPHFPFAAAGEPLPGVLRRTNDTRELLAATLTDPRDDRFAKVIVNRLWRQFMGFGIVDPVDDWETARPSHPELLAWLARELITNGYDQKQVARLILNSAAYQRAATPEAARDLKSSERTFSAQTRRRLTAEQLLDSLLHAAGLEYDTELLTFDPEARQDATAQANLGRPRRAWEFAALSNERDRPALAKPRAQIYADVLAAFGWRESRPEPRTTRDHDPNIAQPALLANGTLAKYLAGIHDQSAFTTLALEKRSVESLVESLFLRVLARPPADAERERFTAALREGYASRLTGADPAPPRPATAKSVSWASHLHPDATTTVLDIERDVKAGPTPSSRLTSDWRDRYEDAVWALLLTPEFAWMP